MLLKEYLVMEVVDSNHELLNCKSKKSNSTEASSSSTPIVRIKNKTTLTKIKQKV